MGNGLTRRKLLSASILAAPLIVPKKSLGLVHGEASTTFNPASLASTLSWWDASDLATITTRSPNKLQQLNDKIGVSPGHAPMTCPQGWEMGTGLEVVNGNNTISAINTEDWKHFTTMRSLAYQNTFPGGEGTIYVVCKVDQAWSTGSPYIFTIRDQQPKMTKALTLFGDDNYRSYFYPTASVNTVLLSRHGLETYSSYMDGLPHIWKITWNKNTGIATFEMDGHTVPTSAGPNSRGSGYVDFGNVTAYGIEINTAGWSPMSGTWQFCEMTLHNRSIEHGSADDVAMVSFLRNKWKTPGLPFGTATVVAQGHLSGGGRVSPLAIAKDGALVIGGDSANCWRWSAATRKFDNIFAQDNLPVAHQMWGTPIGVLDLAIAYTNSNRIYAVVDTATPRVWRSDDGGRHWTELRYTLTFDRSTVGPRMAVDPANQDHLLIVSSDGNLHESTDAGTNFTVRLSNPGGGNGCIVFDAGSGTSVVNGVTVTSKFYMGWTAGFPIVYATRNGGATFFSTSGSGPPRQVRSLACDARNGVVYAVDVDGVAWKYQSGAWSSFSIASDGWMAVAADPAHAGYVAFVSASGNLQFSQDYGARWYAGGAGTPHTSGIPGAQDVVWLQSPFAGGFSGAHPPNFGNNVSYAPSRLAFDPSKSGRLYLSCATGLFHTTPLVYSGQPTPAVDWLQQNRNQQGLPVTDIVKVPQQAMRYDNLMVAVKHKAGFVTCGPRTEPVFMIGGPGNVDGFACDYAKDKTAIQYLLAGSGLWRTTNHGADGFAQPPDYLNSLGAVPGIGSKPMMAVQTLSKLVILSETGKKYTTNGAGTWGDCSFRGLSSFSASNGNAHVLVCDPTNGDTYYVLLPDGNGVWKSTNAGATWTRQTSTSPYPSVLPTNYLDGAQMSAVPGQAGHLFIAGGKGCSKALARSVDGGRTWAAVGNTTEAWQVSAGATRPGGAYPSVFMVGIIQGDSDPGVFRADDFTGNPSDKPTWVRVARAPAGNMDTSNKLFADLDTYGTFYLSMGSTGYCWGELDR